MSRNAIKISAGDYHAIVLLDDGSIKCWGDNRVGQCNPPIFDRPVTSISAGNAHSMVLLDDGSIKCWGDNSKHQLDIPDFGGRKVIQISSSYIHNMVLLEDNTVICWGYDDDNTILSVPHFGGKKVIKISAGGINFIVLFDDGTIQSWGKNIFDILTIPNFDGKKVIDISAGGTHNIVLLEDNTIKLWGSSPEDNNVITNHLNGEKVKYISAGNITTVILLLNLNVIFRWDNNSENITAIRAVKTIKQISSGKMFFIILYNDGSVECKGKYNTYNILVVPPFDILSPVLDSIEYKDSLLSRLTCPVCMTHEKNASLKCGHLLCIDCADKIMRTSGLCPICREESSGYQKIFYGGNNYYKKYIKYKTKYLKLKNNL
jgi:alpha-tubulin suppressor-like RCC1 family protein